MRMAVKTEQLLQDGGALEYVYRDRKAWGFEYRLKCRTSA
jgi:hypothetical protein